MMVDYCPVFDGAQAFYDAAIDGPTDAPQDSRSSRKTGRSYGFDWDLKTGWDGTIKLARKGWPDGRKQIEALAGRLAARVSERSEALMRPAFTRGVVGGAPDVGRYLAGRPDNMIVRKPVRMATPVVRIRLDATASGGIHADTLVRRGAAVCALVELLERTGRRCEVGVTYSTAASRRDGAPRVDMLTIVKRPEAPMQMDQLAFMLAHPAAFRRLGFSVMEQAPAQVRAAVGIAEYSTGYGSPVSSIHWPDANVIVSEAYSGRAWTEAETEAWITEELGKQGIEVRA